MSIVDQDHFSNLTGPVLDDNSFNRLAQFAHETAGLSISPSKSAMVRTRLARRLRFHKIPSFEAYCNFALGPEGGNERSELISALTTNVSHFFREDHHFKLLTEQLVPHLRRANAGSRPIRFWSAGCSNGQEPVSMAISLLEAGFPQATKDLKILATDIDPQVINFAKTAIYPDRMLDGLPATLRDRYFQHVTQQANSVSLTPLPEVSDLISYRLLNLLNPWPMKGKFDAIFCRNVVIYFDQNTQDQLWEKFIGSLRPGGWLFLGHSERISDRYQQYFETQGSTAYKLSKTLPNQAA